MNYNVNDRATVVLTAVGANILNSDCAKYGSTYTGKGDSKTEKWEAGDRYSSELWNIMNIFGPHMYNGCRIPFMQNNITIEPY